jgi:hypothetical protein
VGSAGIAAFKTGTVGLSARRIGTGEVARIGTGEVARIGTGEVARIGTRRAAMFRSSRGHPAALAESQAMACILGRIPLGTVRRAGEKDEP